MAVECWLCGGKGHGQVVLRPDGLADGRRVCHVCVRRLLTWLQAQPADALAGAVAPIWPEAALEPGTPDVESARAAFRESVARALPTLDAASRVSVAIAYLEMGLLLWSLEALCGGDPAAVETLSYASLTSLLSRLLHARALAPDGRDQLERALYPGPERRP